MKNPLDLSPIRFWTLVCVIIPLLAGLVAWATGYLTVLSFSGGFPIRWREVFFQSCGVPACKEICIICGASLVSPDGFSFALDVLFETAIGYSVIMALPVAIRVLKRHFGRHEEPNVGLVATC